MSSRKKELARIRRHIEKVRSLAGSECGHDCFIAETDKAEDKLVDIILGAMEKAHLAGWERIPWEGWK